MDYRGIKYTYEDLEQMSQEELQACMEWVQEEMENGNDYRA